MTYSNSGNPGDGATSWAIRYPNGFTMATDVAINIRAKPDPDAPKSVSCDLSGALLLVFEHNNNFDQLFRQLSRQELLKRICQFTIVPKCLFFRVFESVPYGSTDFRFSEVAEN